MSEHYLNNFSYLFVPFTLENIEKFPEFRKNVTANNGWEPITDNNRYFHRYVSEKISGNPGGETGGYHFRLKPDFAREQDVHLDCEWYSTTEKNYKDQKNICFKFKIAGVEMFLFSTSIGILAFELRFEEDDPLRIAAAQYYLRKIATEKILSPVGKRVPAQESFVDLSRKVLKNTAREISLDFFFYAARNNEKANLLTYVDVPRKKNYDEELFFLKWCYHDGFDFCDAAFDEDSKNYRQNADAVWGISVSAAVCLINRSQKNKRFIENVFQKNFREQYLTTYILLLHQKYMMYLFLTKMSVGIAGKLEELEKYKSRLYDFETNYMFSYISEIPQYQTFYKKVRETFALDALFSDVKEPLTQLVEIQRQNREDEQQAYDDKLNTVLTTLSLLTLISAFVDATNIPASLGWLFPAHLVDWAQGIAGVCVIIIGAWSLIRLRSLKKKR